MIEKKHLYFGFLILSVLVYFVTMFGVLSSDFSMSDLTALVSTPLGVFLVGQFILSIIIVLAMLLTQGLRKLGPITGFVILSLIFFGPPVAIMFYLFLRENYDNDNDEDEDEE